MANDTLLNLATVPGGDRLRDFDDGARKWPAGFVAFGPAGDPGPISAPTIVSSAAPFPVTLGTATIATTLSGSPTVSAMVSNFPATQVVSVANFPAPPTVQLVGLCTFGVSQAWTGIRLSDQSIAAQVVVANETPLPVTLGEKPLVVTGTGDSGELSVLPATVQDIAKGSPSLWPTHTQAPLTLDNYGYLYTTFRGRRAHYIQSQNLIFSTASTAIAQLLGSPSKLVQLLSVRLSAYVNGSVLTPLRIALDYRSSPTSTEAQVFTGAAFPVNPNEDPLSTAKLVEYTADPTTLGSLVVTLRLEFLCPYIGSAPGTSILWDFRNPDGKYPTLLSPNQSIGLRAINTSAGFTGTPPNTIYNYTFEWLEV